MASIGDLIGMGGAGTGEETAGRAVVLGRAVAAKALAADLDEVAVLP